MDREKIPVSFPTPTIKSRSYGTSLDPNRIEEHLRERRLFPRFSPRDTLFIHHAVRGTINNIGMGGLAFTYTERAATSPQATTITLFHSESDCLRDIPCCVVADSEVREAGATAAGRRQCRLCFLEMDARQLEALEQFILRHAMIRPEDGDGNKPAVAG